MLSPLPIPDIFLQSWENNVIAYTIVGMMVLLAASILAVTGDW